MHTILSATSYGKLSGFVRRTVLLFALVFLPLVAAPADSQKKSDPVADKAGSSEPQEDAASFLPNAVELQGATLTVGSVALSPDGKRLAMGTGWIDQPYGELRLWDIDKGRMIATVHSTKGLRSVALSCREVPRSCYQ